MIWPFPTSKPIVEEMKQREFKRKERDKLLERQTGVLQKRLQDALKELGHKDRKENRD